ncbi:MAG: phosphoenolpyruvate carboxylase [bacterium]
MRPAAINGTWLVTAEGIRTFSGGGWIAPLPSHRDDPAGWVHRNTASWKNRVEDAGDADLRELQPFLPRGPLGLAFGAVGASILTRLHVDLLRETGQQIGFPLLPVAAMGASFFRGGMRPDTVGRLLGSCPGVGGLIVDESFRSLWEEEADLALEEMVEGLGGNGHGPAIEEMEQGDLEQVATDFVIAWVDALPHLLNAARAAVRYVPQGLPGMRIEGELDISLFDRSVRIIDSATDAAAMAFTGALTTLGLPPGFAGVGRVLREYIGTRQEEVLLRVLPGLPGCIADTLGLVNQEVLEEAEEAWKGWDEIRDDYIGAAEWVHARGLDMTEDALSHTHRRATRAAASAVMNGRSPGVHLEVAAEVRRYLG